MAKQIQKLSKNLENGQALPSPQQWEKFLDERMQWAVSMYPLPLRPSLETQANYAVEWLALAQQVGCERFSVALVQAVRDARYFPTIADIRQCAGVTQKQQGPAGADAAWLYLQDWLRKWPDCGEAVGRDKSAPRLPVRIAHAARLAGGIRAIEYATDSVLPFVRRDFNAAWERYAESSAAYNDLQLEMPVDLKQLAAKTEMK